MNEFKDCLNGDNIRVTRDFLEKVLFIVNNNNSYSSDFSVYRKIKDLLSRNEEEYEITGRDYYYIRREVHDSIEKSFIYSKEGKKIYSTDEDFDELSKPFYDDLMEWFNKKSDYIDVNYYDNSGFGSGEVSYKNIYDDDLENFVNLLNYYYEFRVREINYYKFRDLLHEKKNIINSLREFCDDLVIEKFESDYNKALNERDINKMQGILENAQKIILNHWQSSMTDVGSFTEGESFKFIGHSMRSATKLNGDYRTRYVSCSLFSEKVMETYNNGYGFILGPENIVGADSRDLYAINDDAKDQVKVRSSVLPPIKAPELILKECIERKRKEPEEMIYSEVIIDGFNPTGIFCFTDGTKTMDYSYRKAMALHKSYPHLKLIIIDRTLYLSEQELFEARKSIIEKIERKLDKNTSHNDDVYYRCFDVFWKKYMELKKNKDYIEEQIMELYKQNADLLFYMVDFDNLFDKYSDEEIEVILKSNYALKLKFILEGEHRFFCFDEVYKRLEKYAGDSRLGRHVPGLSTFLRIYKTVSFSEEEKEEICRFNSFNDINNYIINKRQAKFKDIKEKIEVESKSKSLDDTFEDVLFINSRNDSGMTL